MVVQHNLTAMNANRMLGLTTSAQAKSTERLSSGYKINRAADDAAGLTISEKMRKQIRGLTQATSNAEDGISAVQTAEGAMTEVHDMLQRMNELATKASNGTNSESDRQAIQDEVSQLLTEIDRVAETTKFNEIYLLKGDANGATKTINMEAHDAGLKGTLDVAADGTTAVFTMNEVQSGDTVSIGGKTYTIDDHMNGSITNTVQATLNTGAATAAATLIATADASGNITWSDGNGGDLSTYGLTVENAEDGDTIEITKYTAEVAVAVDAGGTITASSTNSGYGTLTVDTATDAQATLNGIATSELTITATTGGNAAAAKFKIEAADGTEIASDIATGDLANYGLKMAISGGTLNANETWTVSAYQPAGSEVPATATYRDAAKAKSGENVIKADKAYELAKDALEQANGIGATGTVVQDATDKNKFTITMGTTTVAKALAFNLHVGADADMTNKIDVNIETMNTTYLGIKGLDVVGTGNDGGIAGTYAIDAIQDAISKVSAQRSALGAVQNRLEHTVNNLGNIVENTTSAESQIRDTDMATEMVKFANNNILAQAGQSMLAQANQSNQGVLSLLG